MAVNQTISDFLVRDSLTDEKIFGGITAQQAGSEWQSVLAPHCF
jgi:hypothetical protein